MRRSRPPSSIPGGARPPVNFLVSPPSPASKSANPLGTEFGELVLPDERRRWLTDEMRQHEPAVRGYIRGAFPSLEPDDVVQESYLRILRAKAVGGIASTKAYFFSVARNTARTIFRRNRIFSPARISEVPESAVLSDQPDAADSADLQPRLDLVTQAIDRLPAQCRKVIRLAVLEGVASRDIALRLGLAESTVRVQLARGVKRCAEFMRQKGEQ